ncbi:uncharacterized protein FIBRA_06345 [Fibroporia radiculosa]|uniref:F-box domain-containing protein n=1 Tax=Fibroporia radiculosa TaxID=599839 RepID=J4GB78_9APHY|nr:uncharacterized protein FIBRA_06345 [Fibroporia radiculosa]CCM04183.1 predicted protein [Fibroporia radiculosa]
MTAALPNETLFAVFEHLQPDVLTLVIRASSRFQAIAERILYSNISILELLPVSSPVPARTQRCCQSLLAHPHLALLVRSLNVRWQTDPGLHDQYLPFVDPVLDLLNQALRTLVQLEDLDLALGLIGTPIGVQDVLNGCRFPGLRFFAICGLGRGSLPAKYYPAESTVEPFLAMTPSIVHMRLVDHYGPLHLAPHHLPVLSAFRGTPFAAASLIPGRPVRCLSLVGQEHITDMELSRIAQGSVKMCWLDISAVPLTPNVLRDVSHHLTSIETLKFKLALRHTLHHSFTGISILAGLTPVIGAFPALYQLDLSASPVSNSGSGSSLEETALCTTWGRSCPSLRSVVFPSKTEWRLTPERIWPPAADAVAEPDFSPQGAWLGRGTWRAEGTGRRHALRAGRRTAEHALAAARAWQRAS